MFSHYNVRVKYGNEKWTDVRAESEDSAAKMFAVNAARDMANIWGGQTVIEVESKIPSQKPVQYSVSWKVVTSAQVI